MLSALPPDGGPSSFRCATFLWMTGRRNNLYYSKLIIQFFRRDRSISKCFLNVAIFTKMITLGTRGNRKKHITCIGHPDPEHSGEEPPSIGTVAGRKLCQRTAWLLMEHCWLNDKNQFASVMHGIAFYL